MNIEFEVGDVWLSPRDYFYKVISIDGEHAILKMGINGTGRKIRRRKDTTKNWTLQEYSRR